MFNRIVHTFCLVFQYFLVPKHSAPCQDPLHTPLVQRWVSHAQSQFCCGTVALDHVAVEAAMSELCRSLVASIPPPFSGGTFKLGLCISSLELCCSLSCAQPHPSLDLTHWLAFLAKPPTCLVTLDDFGHHGLWLTLVSLIRPALLFLFEYLCLRPWSVRALPLPLLWSPSAPDSPPLAEVAALKCFLTRVPLLIQDQGSMFPFPDHSMKNQYRKYRHTQMLNFEGGYSCTSFLSL